jgi:hypothetical protein
MHQLKTACTVYFNCQHPVVGHLFQDRFKSTIIEVEKYLLEVSRREPRSGRLRIAEQIIRRNRCQRSRTANVNLHDAVPIPLALGLTRVLRHRIVDAELGLGRNESNGYVTVSPPNDDLVVMRA